MVIKTVKQGDGNKHSRHKRTFKRGNVRISVWEFSEDWYWLALSITTVDGKSIAAADVENRKQAAKWLLKNRHLAKI
jgi:hypothetical protein